MDERPSGWYDDPDEPSRLRYWDGTTWTDRTHAKAPMPAPQPPRPVRAVRPSRDPKAEAEGGPGGGADQTGRGDRERPELSVYDSPRPWARGARKAEADVPGTAGGRHRPATGPEPGRAGYGRRVLAFLIDLLVVGVTYLILLTAMLPLLGDTLAVAEGYYRTFGEAVQAGRTPPDPSPEVVAMAAGMWMILSALFVLYDMTMVRTGGTLGHRATGIRVRSGESGGAPTPGRLLIRSLTKYAMFVFNAWPASALIGYLVGIVNFTWPLADSRRRTLHDKWSDTVVVRRR